MDVLVPNFFHCHLLSTIVGNQIFLASHPNISCSDGCDGLQSRFPSRLELELVSIHSYHHPKYVLCKRVYVAQGQDNAIEVSLAERHRGWEVVSADRSWGLRLLTPGLIQPLRPPI